MHVLCDFVEEGLDWVESLALGREPCYTVLGAVGEEDEQFASNYVRDTVLSKLDVPGQGVLSINTYEWYDFANIFDARVKRIYNDERMQHYYDTMV